MNRIHISRLRFLLLVVPVLFSVLSCRKEVYPAPTSPVYPSGPVMLPVTNVSGPFTAFTFEEVPIQVTYLVQDNYSYIDFPQGGSFTYPGAYAIGVYGYDPYVGGPAPYYVTDTFYFTATEPGWYYLDFLQPGGGYIQYAISVY